MYTEQQDGFIALKKTGTDAKGGMLLKLLYEIHARAKIIHLFRLALFGFSHALAVFLTLPLIVMYVVFNKVFVTRFVTILWCMLQKLVSLYQGRQV